MSATRETAAARHDRMVREEALQADALVSPDRTPDIWRGLAGRFRPPADPGGEATVAALRALVAADEHVIDVGAGGGRLTVPLALSCRQVTAVEPSAAMRAVLQEEIARRGLENVRVVPLRWEEAEVEPAALTFAAHVTYGVPAIEPFLRRLDRAATRHAALVVYADAPLANFAPFWRAVHGVERLRLPCRDEVLAVLRELGSSPAEVPLPARPVQPLGTRHEAIDLLRLRLFVEPGTPADERLAAALPALAEERDARLWPKGARANEQSLLYWQPGHFR